MYSQAVLEYVSGLEELYACFGRWIRPGGWSSHQMNYGCLNLGAQWNLYWGLSDFLWRVISGGRGFLINRAPLSAHLSLLRSNRFEIAHVKKHIDERGIRRDRLAPRYRGLSDEDLVTRSAYVLARKTG